MDIDVKNSLSKLLTACECIKEEKPEAVEMIINDTYQFINNISTNNGDKRFDLFSKIYLNGEFNSADFLKTKSNRIPQSLTELCDVDSTILKNSSIKISPLIVSYFMTLGKHYISNGIDRKDVSFDSFVEKIDEMGEFINENERLKAVNVSLASDLTDTDIEEPQAVTDTAEPEKSLEELLEELHLLTGLSSVKEEIDQIINLIKVRNKGIEFGEQMAPLSLHLVFYGNPGTGKTTVARLLAQIYKKLGILSQGQLIEVDRGGLVAGYIGQTAIKTQEVIDKSMGGILFIDEAYTLTHAKGNSDFGQEAVDTILKAMEDHREDFIVIVAGYPELMKEFINSNPGLKSRFNQYINFEDYTAEELMEIFKTQCSKQNLILESGSEEYLIKHFTERYNQRDENYANGRDVRNYFEKVERARSNRLVQMLDTVTHEDYLTIKTGDLVEAEKMLQTI